MAAGGKAAGRAAASGSAVALAEQATQAGLQAAAQFGFDLRGEVVDDFLQDQFGGRSQLVVQALLFGGRQPCRGGCCGLRLWRARGGTGETTSESRGMLSGSKDSVSKGGSFRS